MKYFKIVVVTLFIISTSFYAQNSDISKLMVGFTCGFGGKPTKLVNDMTALIKEKKYHQIVSLLSSKNSGEIYLAIITIERLTKLGLHKLNDEDNFIFSRAKIMPYMIYFCDSCMPDFVSMKSLIDKETTNGAKTWLDETIIIE